MRGRGDGSHADTTFSEGAPPPFSSSAASSFPLQALLIVFKWLIWSTDFQRFVVLGFLADDARTQWALCLCILLARVSAIGSLSFAGGYLDDVLIGFSVRGGWFAGGSFLLFAA